MSTFRLPLVPPNGAIEPGRISRVESYGAFCQLDNYRLRGLIHISQLANFKVERVEDVVSVDDAVWVKVLSVDQEEAFNNSNSSDLRPSHPPRFKLKLSLKDASQDGSAHDLGKQREQQEAVSHQLQDTLNSSIGMGFARDPMAGRLTMKYNQSFNGYSLVGDDEGEPTHIEASETPQKGILPPIGRGRRATLPAWMTKEVNDGPTGISRKDTNSDVESCDKRRKRKKERDSKRRHKHSKHDRKSNRKRNRERSSSSCSDESGTSKDNYGRHRSRKSSRKRRRSSSNSSDVGRYEDRCSQPDFQQGGHHSFRPDSKREASRNVEIDDRHRDGDNDHGYDRDCRGPTRSQKNQKRSRTDERH